jgi:hypothetical protein
MAFVFFAVSESVFIATAGGAAIAGLGADCSIELQAKAKALDRNNPIQDEYLTGLFIPFSSLAASVLGMAYKINSSA